MKFGRLRLPAALRVFGCTAAAMAWALIAVSDEPPAALEYLTDENIAKLEQGEILLFTDSEKKRGRNFQRRRQYDRTD